MSARTPKFEIYQGVGTDWRWRLLSGNGETIASGEGYTSAADALRAVATVKRNVVKIVERERAAA